jgi:hypothetical protein
VQKSEKSKGLKAMALIRKNIIDRKPQCKGLEIGQGDLSCLSNSQEAIVSGRMRSER